MPGAGSHEPSQRGADASNLSPTHAGKESAKHRFWMLHEDLERSVASLFARVPARLLHRRGWVRITCCYLSF